MSLVPLPGNGSPTSRQVGSRFIIIPERRFHQCEPILLTYVPTVPPEISRYLSEIALLEVKFPKDPLVEHLGSDANLQIIPLIRCNQI